jgi:hypothetical protein
MTREQLGEMRHSRPMLSPDTVCHNYQKLLELYRIRGRRPSAPLLIPEHAHLMDDVVATAEMIGFTAKVVELLR